MPDFRKITVPLIGVALAAPLAACGEDDVRDKLDQAGQDIGDRSKQELREALRDAEDAAKDGSADAKREARRLQRKIERELKRRD